MCGLADSLYMTNGHCGAAPPPLDEGDGWLRAGQ
jgi:hypothetical protein